MNAKISKTNQSEAFFSDRLDQVQMSGHERIKAKAHLARAEAMADALAFVASGIARLLRALVVRPYERLTASFN